MKKILLACLAAAVAFSIYRATRPDPIPVETARATVGPMSVFIEEEGEARARDRFLVGAPISGRMDRIRLREGDRVSAGHILTRISPQPLDPRARAEAVSRVAAAEAIVRQAEDRARLEQAQYDFARRERERAETLHRSGDIALGRVEQARTAETTALRARDAARHHVEAARQDVATARATLLDFGSPPGAPQAVPIRAPVAGRLLEIFEESERVVSAGTPIVSIGNAGRLEAVIDVLSTDAVRIQPGTLVLFEDWGGDTALRGTVRVIEPQAFRKVSALGVEERRVHVVADFTDPPAKLGDGYRLMAKIRLWHSASVCRIPADAAFRSGTAWSVFVVSRQDGKTVAALRTVEIGHRSQDEAEVVSGLKDGDVVIVRPPRDLQPRSLVAAPRGGEAPDSLEK
jgi:HlyD family secretion protein